MKSKNKFNKKNMLSDKIADALTVKSEADIEDDHIFNSKPKTVSRADLRSSESEDEAIISDFRKRNVNFLSELSKKYEGEVISRKELEEDSDLSDEEVITEDLKENNKISRKSFVSIKKENSLLFDSDKSNSGEETGESDAYSTQQTQSSNGSASGELDDSDDDDDNNEGYDISQIDEPVQETFEHIKKQNVSEEVKKGNCVRNQLLFWESLLEMRIHLQRCLNTANRMPMPEYYEKLKNDEDFRIQSNKTKTNISRLLDRLMTLQNILLKSFPDTKNLSTSKVTEENGKENTHESDKEISSDAEDEEIPSDTDNEENQIQSKQLIENETDTFKPNKRKRKLEGYEEEIQKTHKAFKNFRDSTIQKWNEKTRLASAANIKHAPTNTILQQILYVLSDRNKLIRRTQLKRSEYDIIGYEKTPEKADESNSTKKSRKDDDEYVEEIFDDSDFYHQLLRELIECKSADISDPVQLSRQWIALQQMRSKMKRKVDTKATKGRKIKYVVHNQLVNLMAPEKSTSWTDESKNELYNSLFGKMFEHNNASFKKFSL